MVVTWSTMNVTQRAVCGYGIDTTNMMANGSITKFVDGGPQQHTQFIHRVTLTNLKPGTKYGNNLLVFHEIKTTRLAI